MFPHVLVVLALASGDPPEAIATFRDRDNCAAIAQLLNKGFERADDNKKAVCVRAVKDGDI